MKILLWVLAAFAVAMWLTHGKRQRVKAAQDKPAPTPLGKPEEMVRCVLCGTYAPVSESVTMPGGMTFCCEEHRRRHSSPDASA